MKRDAVLGLVRHLLTTFGGGYAAYGGYSASELDMAIGGAVAVIGFVWSIIEKRKKATT